MNVTNEQQDRHATILQQSMGLVEVNYFKAVRDGVTAPAVFVCDLEDETVYSFLQERSKGVKNHLAEARRRGVVPIAVLNCSSEEAGRHLDSSVPAAGELSAGKVRDGFYPVAVCAAGITSLRWLPIPTG